MERRRGGTVSERFGFLKTDKGKLCWRRPKAEPHLTTTVPGTVESGAEEPTRQLSAEDLFEVQDHPAAREPAEDPTRELKLSDL